MLRNIAFIILMFTASVGMNAQTEVKAELDSAKILLGDQAVFTISITSPKNILVKMPDYKPGNMLANGVEIVEVNGDTTDISDASRRITSHLSIISWDEGTYTINPQTIVVGGKTYTTERKILNVITMEVDTLHPEQIKPAKDVMDNPFALTEWLPLAAWLIVAVLLIGAIIYLHRLLKNNKRLFPNIRTIKKLLPHEKALQSIEKIKQEQLEQSVDQKTYYTQLTDTLREYLEERFNINAKEMTSGEIVERLSAEEDMTKIDELRELFQTADLVKFAKYSVQNNENAMYLANVAQFVEETKQETTPQMEPSEAEKIAEERQNKRQRRLIRLAIAVMVIAVVIILAYVGWQVYELLIY